MPKFFTWLNNRFALQDPVIDPAGSADAGKILGLDSSGFVSSLALRDRQFQRRRAEIFSDFLGGLGDWIATASGTAAANSLTSISTISVFDVSMPGIVQHSTGTTATGRASVMTNPNAIHFGDYIAGSSAANPDSIAYFRAIFHLPLASAGAETFIYRLGFIDNDSTESTDGCFLRLNANGTAQFVCRNNNSETAISAGTVDETFSHIIEITVTSTAAVLKRYLGQSKTLQGTFTIATNIPTGSTRMTGAGSYLQKVSGTTARTINLDFMYAGLDA